MGGSDDRTPEIGRPTKESLWTLCCLFHTRYFVRDLVLPPWEVGANKSEFLVHEKYAKKPVKAFAGE